MPVALAAGYAQFDENLDQEIADTQRRADEQMYQDKMKNQEIAGKSGGNVGEWSLMFKNMSGRFFYLFMIQ